MTLWHYPTADSTFLNRTTTELFTREVNHTQSSRALGWNTNDHTVADWGFNMSCGSLSPRTFMHDGFTGTMICADPDREMIAILLTNRVYPDPTPENQSKILAVRNKWASAVQREWDRQQGVAPNGKGQGGFAATE